MALKLSKGNRINLTKDVNDSASEKVKSICMGSNWGMITNKILGFPTSKEAVDLDSSVLVYDENKRLIDTIYFGKTRSSNGSILHSGDDRVGDENGDDGLDNEVITVHLDKLSTNAHYLVFILNSYSGQKFDKLPYAGLRIYEGTPKRVDNVLAEYSLTKDEFKGKVALVLGHLYRKDGWWKFKADGEATTELTINEIANGSAKSVL